MENMMFGPGDPAPFSLYNADGRSPFLLTGDHAGSAIPTPLGTLGIDAADRARHIACDIGVRGLGEALDDPLDAPSVHQPYSRLVIDCNRDPQAADAVAEVSDGTVIPGNAALHPAARQARVDAIHTPYHAAIAGEIARRTRPPVLIALHSFTPALSADGFSRPWHVGILHGGGHARFAMALLTALRENAALVVGDNQPYRMDATDYSVPHHAFAQALPYAEIEVRQDLIANPAGQRHWCEILAMALGQSLRG